MVVFLFNSGQWLLQNGSGPGEGGEGSQSSRMSQRLILVAVSLVYTRLPCGLSQQWVTSRQMRFEGGFQGRCNKLVDGCYSFWQAGLLPLLHRALHAQGEPSPPGARRSPWELPDPVLFREGEGNSVCLGS